MREQPTAGGNSKRTIALRVKLLDPERNGRKTQLLVDPRGRIEAASSSINFHLSGSARPVETSYQSESGISSLVGPTLSLLRL